MEDVVILFEDVVEFLKGNRELVLTTVTNQYGDKIPEKYMEIEDGKILLIGINCYSSSWLGLGTCQCNSHDVRWKREISVKEMIEYLKNYIISKLEEIKRREENKEVISNLIRDLERVFSKYL